MVKRRSSAAQSGLGTQSVDRAILLLKEVGARGNRGARLTDLVQDTGIAKPTARRLLAAMVREGMLEQEDPARRYYLGPEMFLLGTLAAARFAGRNLKPRDLHRVSELSPGKYAGDAVRVAALMCDQHAADVRRGSSPALLHESAAGHTSRLTFTELQDHSRRFATVLLDLGVKKGDRVATLLPKGAEVLIAMVAAWRLGAVYMPLFGALGSQPVAYRLKDGSPGVLVTNGTFRRKLPEDLPAGLRIVVVEHDGEPNASRGAFPFWSSVHGASPVQETALVSGDDPFVLLYPAGLSAGPPGLPIPVKALASMEQCMRLCFDVREDDVYWNIADPGWAAGLYYGVLGPLLLGRTTIFCDGPFDVGQVYRVLTKFRVTNLLAPPSWYEKLRAAERLHPPPRNLRLRVASAVGETLSADVVDWVRRRLRVRLHDNYGQAETGVVIATAHASGAQSAVPGSLGRAVPGVRIVVLDDKGAAARTGEEGEIAIDVEKSPLFWFSGYFDGQEDAKPRFRHGSRFYTTGDLARVDASGNVFMSARKADGAARVGYTERFSELEKLLCAQRSIAHALVASTPDKQRGELVKAFVVLRPRYSESAQLAEYLRSLIKPRLNMDAGPPEIEFVSRLP